MTVQHIPSRVIHLTDYRTIAAAEARDFDAAIQNAPSRPGLPRGRRPAPLSVFLAGAVVALAVSWGCVAVIWWVV